MEVVSIFYKCYCEIICPLPVEAFLGINQNINIPPHAPSLHVSVLVKE